MLPEAASDQKLMTQLLKSEMNIMRINCAHDEPKVWAARIANLKSVAFLDDILKRMQKH